MDLLGRNHDRLLEVELRERRIVQVRKQMIKDQITISSELDKRNPAICRFTVNRTLYIGSASFDNKTQAEQSLLAQKLFEIEGITRVQLIGHLLVLSKIPEQEWEELIKQVEGILQAFLVSGFALSQEQVEDRMMLIGRGTKEKVQYLLAHKINPGVAAHAGFVELIDVKDNNVYVRLGGGCQGCGAADFTLRQGIEAILRKEIPEILQVLDVTDHAAGMNPYYRPAK
jgi:Fe-S cluster biogenesis protein NfuA